MKVAEKIQKTGHSSFEIGGILVALELGKTDTSLLNYLNFLANTFKIKEVAVLHVVPKITLFDKALEFDTEPDVLGEYKINEEVIEEMRVKILNKFSEHPEIDIVFDVRQGQPLEELLHETEILEPDIIMIGQNADSNAHGILGKNLIRKVDCLAWVIPENAESKIERILVPIDFSLNSLQALKKAVAMASALEHPVEIIALNIYDMPNFSTYKISRTPEQFKAMMLGNREEAAANFIQSNIRNTEVEVKVKLIEREDPGTGHYIMNFAKNNGVDLIIMGAKGHSKVELLLLGSVTEKVLSLNERIPVLVVN